MPVTTPEPSRSAKKSILIIDDHPLVRRGLTSLIDFEADLFVCGEAATNKGALKAIRASQPHLVLVDLELDGCHGLDLIRDMKIRHPNIPALVLSMHDESVYAERSLRAGAAGYISKQQLYETLLIAIRCVLAGEIYMSDQLQVRLATKCLGQKIMAPDSPLSSLTDRELQVFRLIGKGRTTRQIAEDLSLSIKTIESHREHIKRKLAIDSAAQLVQRATLWAEGCNSGLCPVPSPSSGI